MSDPRVPARTLTTAHLSAAHPFFAAGPPDRGGTLIGRDLITGCAVAVDPWRLYATGAITSPGTLIAGQVGLGKSALVKTWVARQALLGRTAVIIDPKGEYGPLAAAFGASPVVLRPGGSSRINPLDPGIPTADRLAITGALVEQGLGRRMHPGERAALETACRRALAHAEPTLGLVVAALVTPDAADAEAQATTTARLAEDGRPCALELRRLCHGELAGLVDGPTSPDVGRNGPLTVLDLRALHGSPVLGAVMTCIAAWHEAGHSDPGAGRVLVIDEAWALIGTASGAEFFRRSWKLARATGVQNILVVHRITDLTTAGPAGSREAGIAEGLVSESEICVLMRQSPADVAVTAARLGLSDAEASILTRLPRGVALWRIGRARYLVAHAVSSAERVLIDTDAAMRAGTP